MRLLRRSFAAIYNNGITSRCSGEHRGMELISTPSTGPDYSRKEGDDLPEQSAIFAARTKQTIYFPISVEAKRCAFELTEINPEVYFDDELCSS